jgi:RNA polymerase sigma-70 factor, ECF subfamily
MTEDAQGQVTALLQQIANGKQDAMAVLCRLVYDDLRNVARGLMRGERASHTLQPTALVNEALLRLFDAKLLNESGNRTIFFGAAARAMRQVLVDYARNRNALKRAGKWQRTPLDDAVDAFEEQKLDLEGMDEALKKLERIHPRQHEIVQLRFFGGISVPDIAEILNVSQSTVEKDLYRARVFLFGELADE